MSPFKCFLIFGLSSAALLAQHMGGGRPEARVLGGEGFQGRTVTGAPYMAQAVTTTTRTLADGNQIVNTNTTVIARDSYGRTRREQTVSAVGEWSTGKNATAMVFIHDPVSQVAYVLQPSTKTAHKMASPAHESRAASASTATQGTSTAHARRAHGADANVVTESLGSKMIGGVQADGQRFTRTIAAGQIGNTQPITIVKEVWTSAELKTVVMTRVSDPRSGDTVYQLNNIQRTEPDASLFTVPSDYTVSQPGPRGR